MPKLTWDASTKGLAVLLGAIATLLSTTNRCTISDQQATLDSLKFQSASNERFEVAVDRLHDLLAVPDKMGGGNRPMVEFAGLYSIANVQQKLILIEMAQIANQDRSLEALSALAENDDAIINPAPSDEAEAAKIDAIVAGIQQRAQQAISLAVLQKATKVTKVPDDPPLTQSVNATVRANANVLAALPVESAKGWIFIGDASGNQLKAYYANLDEATRTTTAPAVPSKENATLTACRPVNIRAIPFQPNGALGPIISIARPGTVMQTTRDSADQFQQIIRSQSAFNSRKPITARWIYVSVTSQTPGPVPASC
jgi:hypothetical protein